MKFKQIPLILVLLSLGIFGCKFNKPSDVIPDPTEQQEQEEKEDEEQEEESKTYVKDAINDTKMADLFISDCKWQDDNYRNAFWYKGEILKCTTPPNFFLHTSMIRS